MREKPSNIESGAESNETPKTVLNYIDRKHGSIVLDYRRPNSREFEHCDLIARDIAKLLLDAGRQPYIMNVHKNIDGQDVKISPRVYNNRVRFGAHQVCCCDGLSFDPILPRPIAVNDYIKTVFGEDEDIKMEILIPHEQMDDYING